MTHYIPSLDLLVRAGILTEQSASLTALSAQLSDEAPEEYLRRVCSPSTIDFVYASPILVHGRAASLVRYLSVEAAGIVQDDDFCLFANGITDYRCHYPHDTPIAVAVLSCPNPIPDFLQPVKGWCFDWRSECFYRFTAN